MSQDYYVGGLGVTAYDALVGALAPVGDVAFYLACARRFGAKRVLELGAGTGRIALPLAEAGCEVTGVDESAAMLAAARAKVAKTTQQVRARIRFVEAPMQNLPFDDTFDLAVIAARSFQHLVTAADQRATLTGVRERLRDGGHIVVHLFDPRLEFCVPGAPLPAGVREAVDEESGLRVRPHDYGENA